MFSQIVSADHTQRVDRDATRQRIVRLQSHRDEQMVDAAGAIAAVEQAHAQQALSPGVVGPQRHSLA
jgi:cell division septal protein FtsQ